MNNKRYKRNGIEILKDKTANPIKRNKTKKGYPLNEHQIDFLKSVQKQKDYRKVYPTFKSMITTSINNKRVINKKHLYGVNKALKFTKNNILEFKGNLKQKSSIVQRKRENPFQEMFSGTYEDYLKTGIWKRKRIYLLKKRGAICQSCNNITNNISELHVHHRTYTTLGKEKEQDLTILCKTCHTKLHDKYTHKQLEQLFKKSYDKINNK